MWQDPFNDVILIDKAINESLLNLGLSETEVEATDGVHGDDENIIHEENVNSETEELIENEKLNHCIYLPQVVMAPAELV